MQPTTPQVLSYGVDKSPQRWRVALGFVVAIAGGVASGIFIANAGFGIFPAWLLLSITTPLVSAIVAPVRRRFMAVFAAVLMNCIVFGRIAFFPDGGYPRQMSVVIGLLIFILVLGLMSVAGAWGIGSVVASKLPAA